MAAYTAAIVPGIGNGRARLTTLFGVFLAAFLAATILPFYSEFAVGAAILAGNGALSVWVAATVGNTLGAVVNAVLGRFLATDAVLRRLHIGERQFAKASSWFEKWGVWSLLLAWLPIGGDALTVVAGALRVRWWVFLSLVSIGKGARYAVLILLLQEVGN